MLKNICDNQRRITLFAGKKIANACKPVRQGEGEGDRRKAATERRDYSADMWVQIGSDRRSQADAATERRGYSPDIAMRVTKNRGSR